MNDPRPPLTDDELSAHLDGEGAPDVAERLAADPRAAARLDQLRAAAQAVGTAAVAPLDPDAVDDLVARALDAGPGPIPRHPDAPDAAVAPLGRPPRALPSVLVAAVVLVLVAAGLGLVWSGTRSDDTTDTASTASSETAERQADAAPEAAPGTEATDGDATASGADADGTGSGGSASPTTVAGTASYAGSGVDLPNLGTFDTPEALRSSLATSFPADAPVGRAVTDAGEVDQAAVDRCDALLVEVLPVQGDVTHVGFAAVAGEVVLVYEWEAEPDRAASTTTVAGAPATTLTTAVRPKACDPLFVFQR